MNANDLSTNLLVTALVAAMAFVLPWADRRICRKAGLDLRAGTGAGQRGESLLRLRSAILTALFLGYLGAFAWLALFSRSAARDYSVHVALFQDLARSVRIDPGFLGLLRTALTEGIGSAASRVRILHAEDIAQVYMNVMLFVPMGYLLPYIFRWFRAKPRTRPAAACFLISLAMENLQLITRRGFYDVDDLVSNTIGGIIGQLLFLSAAYTLTHPDWRKELRAYRRWRHNARERTMYPFVRKTGLNRVTLYAAHEEEIWDFYVMKLGFRPVRQLVPEDSPGTDILLEMGRTQVEFRCTNGGERVGRQALQLSARRLGPVAERLRRNGIDPGEPIPDPYSGLPCIRFTGPDGTEIGVIGSRE